MSEDTAPLVAIPDGPSYVSPLTRFAYRDDIPEKWGNARACILEDGTQFLAVRPGLTREKRREAVRKALARIHAPGRATAILYGADLLRRAAQPAQRAAHLLTQIPAAVKSATTGPAVITTALAVGAIGVSGAAVRMSGIMDRPAYTGPYYHSPAWYREHHVYATLPAQPLAYLGVYEPTSPDSYAGIETFAQACGRQPNLAVYYSGWGEPFHTGFAGEAAKHGAIPLVQWNPELGIEPFPGMSNMEISYQAQFGIGLDSIADGTYDDYLVSYADQVSAFGRPVVISFAPEANGTWYPWSAQPAADYVAAWRHIVRVFRKQGADNVTWMWDVNVTGGKHTSADLAQWWPGENYVTWVGVDGYYRHPADNWASVFGPTIAAIGAITAAPLLIAETAIGPVGTEPSQLRDMYANIRADGDLGLVWFDEDKPHLPYRLEGDSGAIAMFRKLTAPWRLARQHARAKG